MEAHAIDTLTSLRFLQNCLNIGELNLYKTYALPAIKTIASIITGLQNSSESFHAAGPNISQIDSTLDTTGSVHDQSINRGGNSSTIYHTSTIVLNRVKSLLTNFIENNVDILTEFLKKSSDTLDEKLQFYLLQIVHFGCFSVLNEVDTNLWPVHQRLLPKIFDLLRDSTLLDSSNGVEKAWILINYSKTLILSQINSCRDLSIHWDMIKSSNHQANLKLFVDLFEPLGRKIEQVQKKVNSHQYDLDKLDEMSLLQLKKIIGTDENSATADIQSDSNTQVADKPQKLGGSSSDKNLELSKNLASTVLNNSINHLNKQLPLYFSCLESSILIVFKVIEIYTQPVIQAKKNFQTYWGWGLEKKLL